MDQKTTPNPYHLQAAMESLERRGYGPGTITVKLTIEDLHTLLGSDWTERQAIKGA